MIMFPLGLMAYFFADAKIGAVLAVVSLLVLLAGSGLMNFYIKVSGLLGSVVSYARLLALMASSSGIAMTVNFLSMLALSVPHAGVILAPLVFIGGHVINLALNILGSFVHSLRLHYVEFFGTFYEGGGVEFAPFSKIRKYSMLERR
jgi:V/A-type H+-transporting ATPase subunit I